MRTSLGVSLFAGVCLIVLIALTGSYDVVEPLNIQDDVAIPAGNLIGSNTIGQTFVAHSPHLSAIQVQWIVSDDFAFSPNSRVVLHLRQRVDDSRDVATASISFSEIRHNEFSKFAFSPIRNSQDAAYYFFLDVSQAEIIRGWLSVWASRDDALPDGQMYLDGISTDRDLALRVLYSPDLTSALRSLSQTLARQSPGIPFVVLILLVPGLVLLCGFGNMRAHHPVETLSIASGLSLAVLSAASIILLWLGVPAYWLFILIAIAGVGFVVHSLVRSHGDEAPTTSNVSPDFDMWALAALALLSLAVGFIQFADLPAPLWVDSPTHASYVKTYIDYGRLPLGHIYHLGYHSIVALLVQLSGLSIPQAMLLVGQLIVTQIGLSVFLLGKRLSGSNMAGLVSAICVWFLTPAPAYFVTWGRYPLLLGAAILPLALFFVIGLIEQPRFAWRPFLLAAVTFAGLAFAHIRLIAFYFVFVAIYLAYWNLPRAHRASGSVMRIVLLGGAGLLTGLIWLAALLGNRIGVPDILERSTIASVIDLSTAIAVMQSHHGPIVWTFATIGVLVTFVWRRTGALLALVWFALLLGASALPQNLLGGEYVAPSFVTLMGFLPAALIVGELAGHLLSTIVAASDLQQSARVAAVWIGAGLLISLFGAREMLSIINPTTILFTRADEKAMPWIKEHTPDDARFLVNSFEWYELVYVPSDGGSWIPYLTNRAGVFLDGSSVSVSHEADALARWIDARRITYIYLGRRAGILHESLFVCYPNRYAFVYQQDGIRIFRVKDTAEREQPTLPVPLECSSAG